MIGSADARRAALYRQLAALEEAGIPLRTAIDKVVEPDLRPVGAALDKGLPPHEAWAESRRFTPLEVTLVGAGTKSGQLAETFRSLERNFEETAKTKRALLVGLAYPIILIHLAVFLPKLYLLVMQGIVPYLEATLVPLLEGYAVLVVIVLVLRAFSRSSPAAAGALLQAIPGIGGFVKHKALAHGLSTLVTVYRAGVPVTDAVDAAASAATLHSVREAFLRIRRRLDQGATIGDAFLEEKTFPTEVREAGSTGSITGKLDEQLSGAVRRIESEASTRKSLLLTVVPILTYLCVAAAIAYNVISFWTNFYGSQLDFLK